MFLSPRRLFICLFIIIFFALTLGTLFDPDLWWHLRTGEYILETRMIPHTDIFSFTRAGSEWITHEWLSELLMYATFVTLGWGGLIIGFPLLSTAAFAITFLRDARHLFTAGLALLLSALTAWTALGPRPWMFSILLASIFLYVLNDYARNGKTRGLWFLAPLMVLWVNLHGGFELGPVVTVLYAVGIVLDGTSEKKSLGEIVQRVRPLFFTLITVLAAIVLNPNGARMYSYPLETLTSPTMQKYITEWFSPDFHQLTMQPLALQILATFTVLALSRGKARASDVLFAIVFAYGALRSVRNIPYFALVSLPILTDYVGAWFGTERRWQWLDRPQGNPKIISALNAVVIVGALVLSGVQFARVLNQQNSLEADRYPLQAVNYIGDTQLPAPLFSRYEWGGYLIWKLYPDYRVFIDGRADVYGEAFLDQYVNSYYHPLDGLALLKQYNIRTVLLPPDAPIAAALRDEVGWTKVFEDDKAIIFTRE